MTKSEGKLEKFVTVKHRSSLYKLFIKDIQKICKRYPRKTPKLPHYDYSLSSSTETIESKCSQNTSQTS